MFHVYINGAFNLQASGIKVDRCFVGNYLNIVNSTGTQTSGIIIKNSYIINYLGVTAGFNHVITNNIVGTGVGVVGVGSNVPQATITHNVINARTNADIGSINNSIVENNIFNKATSAYTFNNSYVQYNMSGAAGVLPAGNNNQNSVAMSTVFVNNSGTDDASFVLKAGSPAIGAGSTGANLGAFGGTSPFKLGLQPAIPAIYKISAPAAPSGNTLNVTFSTKSNN